MSDQISDRRADARAETLKTALLASVSHDFRTPLTAISASASSLIDYRDRLDAATSDRLLLGIVEECDRLNRYTANLLEMGRLESGEGPGRLQTLSVSDMLGAVIQRIAARHRARPGDRARLRRGARRRHHRRDAGDRRQGHEHRHPPAARGRVRSGMTGAHILVVDDEPSLVAILDPVLTAAGHRVTVAVDGASALAIAETEQPDLMLLDLGLPDMDGKDLIRATRARGALPIIVVSARHQEAEKIAALDEGADDYVDKPFEIGLLMARIRAAMRRTQGRAEAASYRNGPLAIDLATRRVTLDGQPVKLSPKEWGLLSTLALNAGRVVTHKRLLAAGWGADAADTQYLRVYIGLLRQKLEAEPSDPLILLTEPGIGYRLAALP